ncbi:MAG TPA: hypothetical protein ENK32_02360 [Anaerolineae bacterium]|nr:hypothetical protein [Anaerolineae bacterium]
MDNFFGIGLPELILILVIAGIVMGPERIVLIARWLGKTTAQLQSVSRAFVRQLHAELDGVDDGDAFKDVMNELQGLRSELESLKGEFTSIATGTVKESKDVIQEIENSIKPPSLMPPEMTTTPKAASAAQNGDENKAAANGAGESDEKPAATPSPSLPNILEVPDDPE